MIASRTTLATLAVSAACAATAHPARADARADLLFAIEQSTHDYYRAMIVDKLVTFKLGAKCWAKVADKDSGLVVVSGGFGQEIGKWAKAVTGDDWNHIETQNNNDRANNKKLIEPMIDAFGKLFSLTVTVEGDDCDLRRNALWLQYYSSIGAALDHYPPAAGKAFVTLDVKAKVKKMTIEVSKDGTRFAITAPRDFESVWSDDLDNAFKKVSSKR